MKTENGTAARPENAKRLSDERRDMLAAVAGLDIAERAAFRATRSFGADSPRREEAYDDAVAALVDAAATFDPEAAGGEESGKPLEERFAGYAAIRTHLGARDQFRGNSHGAARRRKLALRGTVSIDADTGDGGRVERIKDALAAPATRELPVSFEEIVERACLVVARQSPDPVRREGRPCRPGETACSWCGKGFRPQNASRKNCSKACYELVRRRERLGDGASKAGRVADAVRAYAAMIAAGNGATLKAAAESAGISQARLSQVIAAVAADPTFVGWLRSRGVTIPAKTAKGGRRAS